MARGLLARGTVLPPVSLRWLPRWSRFAVVAALVAVGAALVSNVWLTWRAVADARATFLRGLAAEAAVAVRTTLSDAEHEPAATRAAAALDATRAQHVRYVALFERGGLIAEAGVPSRASAELAAWFAIAPVAEAVEVGGRIRIAFKRPPPMRGGGRPGRGPTELLLEIDPASVDALDAAAARALIIGVATALLLLVLAVVLVRWSLRREAAVRAVEQARHLANLGQMSAVLAHEIRNPLASLKGNAQLLARALPEGERNRAKADRVVEEAVRLEHLTNDLLAFARSGEIHPTPTDPVELVRAAAAAVAPGRIEVIDDDAPRSWPVDGERLRQVLVNLFDNAVALSERPVTATVGRAGSALRLVVRDHGPGLPDGDAARIFEPFFTTRTRGTGLGLAVCKRLVEAHGGTIAAAPADGGGAAFTIVLPRAVR